MKNLLILAFLGMFITSISANTAAHYSSAQLALKVKASGLPAQIGQMSVSDFVEITPSQVKQITGQRLHFKEVVALKALNTPLKKNWLKMASLVMEKIN